MDAAISVILHNLIPILSIYYHLLLLNYVLTIYYFLLKSTQKKKNRKDFMLVYFEIFVFLKSLGDFSIKKNSL